MRIKVSEIVRAFNHAHNISATSSSYESLLNSDTEAKPYPKKAASVEAVVDEDSDTEDEEIFSEDDDSVDDTASLDDLLKSLGG